MGEPPFGRLLHGTPISSARGVYGPSGLEVSSVQRTNGPLPSERTERHEARRTPMHQHPAAARNGPLGGDEALTVSDQDQDGRWHSPVVWLTPCSRSRARMSPSPIKGVIVRWRMMGNAGGASFQLRVVHPEGGGEYIGAGTSSPGVPTGPGPSQFATSLPINAGDMIGINIPSGVTWNGHSNAPHRRKFRIRAAHLD